MKSVVGWFRDRIDPSRVSVPELGVQQRSMSELLPHECMVKASRQVVLLDGGSLGVIWELELLEHEVLPNDRLSDWTTTLAGVVQGIVDPAVVFQVLMDTQPGTSFETPEWYTDTPSGDTVARAIVRERVNFTREGGRQRTESGRVLNRRLYLTLRLEGDVLREKRWSLRPESLESALERQEVALGRALATLAEHAQVVEEGLGAIGWRFRQCDGPAVLDLLRSSWNDDATLEVAKSVPYHEEARIREQVCRGRVRALPGAVQVGEDTWECVSWLEQPPLVYEGLFTALLQLTLPSRVVVNLRPCLNDGDLAISAQTLKPATDELGIRHREELQNVERRKAYGEQLMCVSVHVFVRNEGVSLEGIREHGFGRSLANQLTVALRMPWIHEELFCAALMQCCQPLCYKSGMGRTTGRERRVLTGALSPYLPLFSGYGGTKGGHFLKTNMTQLMVSRAGDPIWLSCRDSITAPHLAVLASTGGGKSFFMANLMTAELAANPDSLIFIIDSITSYRIFGEVMGEKDGFQFSHPPKSFPNIFRGDLDVERVQVIVGILCTAITLEDPSVVVTSEHRQLLAEAVNKTYADAILDAETSHGATGFVANVGKLRLGMRVPRLSDVVDNLVSVAEQLLLSTTTAQFLRAKLGAYYGTGSYAKFFDQDEIARAEDSTPRVMLYDLERVAGDPALSTLTMVCCIAEILRHLRKPDNVGRKGMLVIDEAGVLASGSQELERFIKDAWKTFRKLGIICAGLTNEVDDYREKAAPRTMWANSPNKVLLRLSATEVEKLGMADASKGIPRLVGDEHLQALAGSLQMRKGVYSHGLWMSERGTGTFLYEPTGHDYWLAASKPIEVKAFLDAATHLGGMAQALQWLATFYPSGIRDKNGEHLPFDASLVKP